MLRDRGAVGTAGDARERRVQAGAVAECGLPRVGGCRRDRDRELVGGARGRAAGCGDGDRAEERRRARDRQHVAGGRDAVAVAGERGYEVGGELRAGRVREHGPRGHRGATVGLGERDRPRLAGRRRRRERELLLRPRHARGLPGCRGAADRRVALRLPDAGDREADRHACEAPEGDLRAGGHSTEVRSQVGGDLREARTAGGNQERARARADRQRPELAGRRSAGERHVGLGEGDAVAVAVGRGRRGRDRVGLLGEVGDATADQVAGEVEAERIRDRQAGAVRGRCVAGHRVGARVEKLSEPLRDSGGGQRVGRLDGVGVVVVAQAQRPDVADEDGARQLEPDRGVEGPVRRGGRSVDRVGDRVEHRRRDLERVDVEGAVARPLNLGVRGLPVDRAAERGVAGSRVEEVVEVRAGRDARVAGGLHAARIGVRVDVLRAPERVVLVVRLHRRRREDKAGDRVARRRDLELVGDAVRDRVGELPGADLDVVLAGGRERVGEEVVVRIRAPAGALGRQRVSRPGREQVAVRVVEQQVACPDALAVQDVLAGVDVERLGLPDHRGRDVELVEVVGAGAGRVDGEVRRPGRVDDVRVVVQAPAAEIEILRGRERVVEGDRVHLRRPDAAVEAGDRVVRLDGAAGV